MDIPTVATEPTCLSPPVIDDLCHGIQNIFLIKQNSRQIRKIRMTLLLVRRTLGISWFIFLVVLTALIVIAMDANTDSIHSAFALPYLSSVLMLSVLIGLAALPSFLFFRQRRWFLGFFAAVVIAIFSWVLLQILQTTPMPLSLTEIVILLPQVIAILGGWTILISLPSALLLKR